MEYIHYRKIGVFDVWLEEGYPGEEVILDGTVALDDNNSNWVGQYSHALDNGTSINIYKTHISIKIIEQKQSERWSPTI